MGELDSAANWSCSATKAVRSYDLRSRFEENRCRSAENNGKRTQKETTTKTEKGKNEKTHGTKTKSTQERQKVKKYLITYLILLWLLARLSYCYMRLSNSVL